MTDTMMRISEAQAKQLALMWVTSNKVFNANPTIEALIKKKLIGDCGISLHTAEGSSWPRYTINSRGLAALAQYLATATVANMQVVA